MPEARTPQRAQGQEGQGSIFRTIAQSVGIFLLVQFAMKQFIPQSGNQSGGSGSSNEPIPDFNDRPITHNADTQYAPIPFQIAPIWPSGTPLDLKVYVSSSLVMPPLSSVPSDGLVVEENGFRYGDYGDSRTIHTSFPVPDEVQKNGTLWAHFFVAKAGEVMDPLNSKYDITKAYHFVWPFTQYLSKKKVKKARSLLSAGSNATEDEVLGGETPKGPTLMSYYHPNFTLSFVPEMGVQSYQTMHPAIRSFVQLERSGARDASGQNGWYYPTLYVNTFFQLKDHMTELNNTVKRLPMNIKLNNFASWKFSVVASMDEGMKLNAAKAARGEAVGASGDGSEFEQFKRILLDSNVYLLGTTAVVSILHMIFEALAFKSDVAHWRKKKDNVGTSLRTILANVFMQAVIFLYLLDNNENTSWMILFSQGIGIAIEAWKITKTVNVRLRPTQPGSLVPYSIVFEDKHKLSETEKKTQEYDQIAFKYLYIVAVPLLLAYAAYSLVYDTHKSWYSFIITTLVGSVYAYGFLMMVPSLYINYRLKSVAHMPGKAMMYKFLNTFIDDLFAFTIKMPMLHRLATLRDDVIFFVYLYQTWAYKIDYSRVNEFGQGGEDDGDDKAADKSEPKPKEIAADDESTKKVEGKTTGASIEGQGRKRK